MPACKILPWVTHIITSQRVYNGHFQPLTIIKGIFEVKGWQITEALS